MIEVQHLTKRYGAVTAVDDVSFKVERGEILGFLGPNGAGKTTTMRVLTGYMPPTEGKAIIAGYDVMNSRSRPSGGPDICRKRLRSIRHDRQRISAVLRPHQRRVEGERKEQRHDRDGAHARRRHGEATLRQTVEGVRQRVGLAQALLNNPDVLILDEPTAGLDPKQIIETRRLIKELGRRPHHHSQHAHPSRKSARPVSG